MREPEVLDDERAHLARQLAEAEAIAHLGSWEWYIDQNVVRWSDELFRIHGLEPQSERITYELVLRRIHPEDRARVQRSIESCLRDGGEFELEHRILRADGAVRRVLGRGRLVRAEDDAPLRMVGTAADVTERLQAQAADRRLIAEQAARAAAEATAQRSEFLLEAGALLVSSLDFENTLVQLARLVVHRMADWCVVHMPKDGALLPLEVAHVNPERAEQVRELQERYPVDPTSTEGVAASFREGRSLLYPEITEALLEQVARDAQHLQRLRDLGIHSAMVVPLATRGHVLGTITFVAAERERGPYGPQHLAFAEQLARHAALAMENARLYRDVQETARARDEVLAIVSHDLRNPLNVIGLSATLVGRPGLSEDRRRDAATTIRRAVAQMNRLIQDLMDVTRLRSGSFELERQVEDVADVVAEAGDLLRALAQEKRLRVQVDVAEALASASIDRGRVLQVLSNLVGNAVKFSAEGGSVTLTASPDEASGGVHLTVRDQGPGISPEHLPRLFDRFYQGSRRSADGGSGLGLSICKGLVDAHGGRIWVESTLGVGTTVHVVLPPAPPAGEDG